MLLCCYYAALTVCWGAITMRSRYNTKDQLKLTEMYFRLTFSCYPITYLVLYSQRRSSLERTCYILPRLLYYRCNIYAIRNV